MPIQKCPLCLEVKPIVDSHLVPSALYAYCDTPEMSPVRIGGGVVFPTDRQIHDYLLCEECEGLLNRGGEAWMNPKFCTMQRTFPFYELLVSGPIAENESDGGLYFAESNPRLDTEKLTHFAMGIFWKASVHSWKRGEINPVIELGPYSEHIRTWLRGETDFPKNVCLSVMVSPPHRAQITLNGPMERERTECRNFIMHFLGILFTMGVGSQIDPEFRLACFSDNPKRPIIVSERITDSWSRNSRSIILDNEKRRHSCRLRKSGIESWRIFLDESLFAAKNSI
jgi:hypothetical protein